MTSSARFKEEINDMGDTSSKLLQLRPVTFYYKPEYDDGSHLLQYGLVAEEVAKVYPEMVAYGKDGQTVDGEVSDARSDAAWRAAETGRAEQATGRPDSATRCAESLARKTACSAGDIARHGI